MPLLVLLAALFFLQQSYAVIGYGICFRDFDLVNWWSNYHIGASGLIYVLTLYFFFKGILTRYYRLVALSLAVIIMYGGIPLYVFFQRWMTPFGKGIWQV
jgi:hypothetical protein